MKTKYWVFLFDEWEVLQISYAIYWKNKKNRNKNFLKKIGLDQTGKAWVQEYSMMWPVLVDEIDYWIEIGQKLFDIWKDLSF